MGRLTTHVLDLVRGTPAGGMTINWLRSTARPAAWSRPPPPITTVAAMRRLLEGETFRPGRGSSSFMSPRISLRRGVTLAEPPFLDVVVVRFGVAKPAQNHHVPLLVTPWSYSTYRGS